MNLYQTMKQTYFIIAVTVLFNIGCKSYKEQEDKLPDTPYRGKIYVSADETFKPIIDEHVQVYESNNPGTKTIKQKRSVLLICLLIPSGWLLQQEDFL